MANEKRLIDANAMRQDWLENGENEFVYDTNAVLESIEAQPTVDAVVLPCEVGTQIWLTDWHCCGMRWMKLSEPKPRNIHHFDITKDGIFAHFKDGCINIKYFGEIVFLTKEEAEAALAKMDGGNEEE